MKEIICLSVFIICSLLFAVLMITTGFLCQYRQPAKIKSCTYECGVVSLKETPKVFDIKFFNYAILFLIFDIETIFLYPIAIYSNALTPFVILELFLFIGILLSSLFFALKKHFLRFE